MICSYVQIIVLITIWKGINEMKNTEKFKLMGVIAMTLDEFTELVEEITDGLLTTEYEEDFISFTDTDKAEMEETYWNEDIEKALSDYFDIEVVSWHSDGCEYPTIFICYKIK